MRNTDELKKIFLEELTNLFIENKQTVLTLPNLMKDNNEQARDVYESLRKKGKDKLDKHNVTDEEMKIIQANQMAWSAEVVDIIFNNLNSN